MLCLSGFELYSRWVPLTVFFDRRRTVLQIEVKVVCIPGSSPSGWAKEESTTNDDKNLETLLQRCPDYGIILNGDKMEVRNIDVV